MSNSQTIFKTWKPSTYIKGSFMLRTEVNHAQHPVMFPVAFVAKTRGIKSSKYRHHSDFNPIDYIVDTYFDGIGEAKHDEMYYLFLLTSKLQAVTWQQVEQNKDEVLTLINQANNELLKLKQL